MPLITFEGNTLSSEMKAQLIKKLTDVSAEITGIPREAFFISIRELPDENLAIGGKSVLEIKKERGIII